MKICFNILKTFSYFFRLKTNLSILILCQSISQLTAQGKWSGTTYNLHSSVQRDNAIPLIKNMKFYGNEKILDVGSGDGYLTFLISKRLQQGTVIGLDKSKSMTNFSKSNYRKIKNLKFITLDALV